MHAVRCLAQHKVTRLQEARQRRFGLFRGRALHIAADVRVCERSHRHQMVKRQRVRTAADLRSWTALPKHVMAVRLDRPADGVVQVVADTQVIPVTVPEGNSLVFIRKAAPSASPSVKIATFR